MVSYWRKRTGNANIMYALYPWSDRVKWNRMIWSIRRNNSTNIKVTVVVYIYIYIYIYIYMKVRVCGWVSGWLCVWVGVGCGCKLVWVGVGEWVERGVGVCGVWMSEWAIGWVCGWLGVCGWVERGVGGVWVSEGVIVCLGGCGVCV